MLLLCTRQLRFLAILLLFAPATVLASDPQFVGFLEDRLEPAVRVAFVKTGGSWRSFCPPEQAIVSPDSCHPNAGTIPTRWSTVYRGAVLSPVETSTYGSRFVSDVGLYTLKDDEEVPRVGEQDREFAGQIDHTGYRPLVALSLPKYSDPEKWAALNPADVDVSQLWHTFREKAGDANTCVEGADGEEKSVPWEYQAKDVRVFQAYTSRSGARLIALHLDPALDTCDVPHARQWSTFWFYVEGNSHVRSLDFVVRKHGSNTGYTAKVLDWGDYDGDGKSEMIFWIEADNQDGYALFYDDFSREATFTWIYH